MNKQYFAFILILSLAYCVGSSSCNQKNSEERSKTNVTKIPSATKNDLPGITIVTLEGDQLLIKNQQGKVVLVMFQPECDDCQREAVQIRDNIDAFKEYSLFFISSAPMQEIGNFKKDYKLDSFNNVVFGQTTVQNVINTLGTISAPSVYIYSNEGKLVKFFNGEVDIKEIKPFL
jgi:peroxiredoxin